MSGAAVARQAKPSAEYGTKLARTGALLQQTVRRRVQQHSDRSGAAVTQASSLGAEDMVLSHLIDTLGLPIDIFVLDTGMLHAPTLALLERLKQRGRLPVRVFRPQSRAAIDFVAREGAQAMYRSIELRKACCAIRKTEPLARALAGYDGWITGMRREQSPERAAVPLVDESQARTKYNPLAEWTQGDVWHYVAEHQVDYNPLHDDFFPSIGCAPCTRAVSLGEDARAGRWWWEDDGQKECGLHLQHADRQGIPA